MVHVLKKLTQNMARPIPVSRFSWHEPQLSCGKAKRLSPISQMTTFFTSPALAREAIYTEKAMEVKLQEGGPQTLGNLGGVVLWS